MIVSIKYMTSLLSHTEIYACQYLVVFWVVYFGNFCYVNGYVVVSHYDFNLHFQRTNDAENLFICLLVFFIFFCKISVQKDDFT